eukprot:798054-Amphidinium_carterae.1
MGPRPGYTQSHRKSILAKKRNRRQKFDDSSQEQADFFVLFGDKAGCGRDGTWYLVGGTKKDGK